MEVDANEVIKNLSMQLAQKSIEVATLQAQIAKLQYTQKESSPSEG